jgi:hypothetical protein
MRAYPIVATLALCCLVAARALNGQQGSAVSQSDGLPVLPDSTLLIEDVAWDARSATWYISSVHQRRILAIGPDGRLRDFVPAGGQGLWAAFAMALDTARNRLWVTTTATPEGLDTPRNELGRTAVLGFELQSGKLVARHELARDSTARALADIALMEDGSLVVSDSRGGGLYALHPDRAGLDPIVSPGSFRSPQGPAGIPGTGDVLVADYAAGLARVNRATGAVRWLEGPAGFVMKGIDGIQLRGHTLLVVQNGVRPNRVARLAFDEGYTRILSAEILDTGPSALSEPTHGTWVGDDFVFIANSGWAAMREDGSFAAGAVLERPVLRRLHVAVP